MEWVLEGAARVFKREGFGATTNRIARAAGVSIGTLYEYFPNKEALLLALAERHVTEAESGIQPLLASDAPNPVWLAALQAAVLSSHRYPSQAIEALSDAQASSDLRRRAAALRAEVMTALVERARATGRPEPEVRARVVFGMIAELSSLTAYECTTPDAHVPLARHLLELAVSHLAP